MRTKHDEGAKHIRHDDSGKVSSCEILQELRFCFAYVSLLSKMVDIFFLR